MNRNLLRCALAKATFDRDALSPGVYDVDALVRVSGQLTIGEDYETTPTVSLPVKEVLALFAARAGFTRERTIELLRECVSDAIAEDGRAAGAIAEKVAAVDEYLAAIKKDLLDKLPKATRRGAVRGSVKIEEVETISVGQGTFSLVSKGAAQ